MTADPTRWFWTVVVVALWLLLVAAVSRSRDRSSLARGGSSAPGEHGETVLVAFATQTGLAEELARRTAGSLSDAGTRSRVVPLDRLDATALRTAGRVLIIASTTGEGDAPDDGSRFVRRTMSAPADLAGLRYGLLALGDQAYTQFCGFGRALDAWLEGCGAERLFDRVEVDDGDSGAIRRWQHRLGVITGSTIQPDWSPPAYDSWILVERRHLNPGSPGGEAWLLALAFNGSAPHWSAGDIAEIGLPPGDDGANAGSREYSVASLPHDGRAEIIVRRIVRPDGCPGLASGWLTHELAIGDTVDMRMRANRGFHGPAASAPLVLIGNGAGLAGLRAHWKARAGRPHGGTWLMFGERTRAYDAFLDDELQAALVAGDLTRIDRVFSRDADDGRYVQALIAENAVDLSAWIGRGATILVCGSREGMSTGVQSALTDVLGCERLTELAETGRYRRDVY